MIDANPSLQVHVTEKRARPFVTSPHRDPLDKILTLGNHNPKRSATDFFNSLLEQGDHSQELEEAFAEHDHGASGGAHHRDNNMRAAVIHVIADAAVSVLVIAGLLMARAFGWLWMDPLAGLVGAIVIANWSFGLLRDTGGILLDRTPDAGMAENVRAAIEWDGDRVTDLHLWRLGPGHLGAIISVVTTSDRVSDYYHQKLAKFADLSHVTVEVRPSHFSKGFDT